VEIIKVLGWNSMAIIASLYGLDSPRLNPGGDETFHTCPEQPWGPLSLLYNGYQVSFPGVKRPGCSTGHPPQSSAEGEERVIPLLPSGLRSLFEGDFILYFLITKVTKQKCP